MFPNINFLIFLLLHSRTGGDDLWFESQVLFSTHSQSAIGTNCSKSDNVSAFDFCHVNQWIIFEPNATSYNIGVRILNDAKAENTELFAVKLSHPKNAVFGHDSLHYTTVLVSLEDTFDCK